MLNIYLEASAYQASSQSARELRPRLTRNRSEEVIKTMVIGKNSFIFGNIIDIKVITVIENEVCETAGVDRSFANFKKNIAR